METTEIKQNIFWVGAEDWDIRDFHGYNIPQGTSYNSYLIKDEKVCLLDTVKESHTADLIKHIKQVVGDPEKIDYIVVNHVEVDHTGALSKIIDLVKPEKIICSSMGKKNLLAHYHREDWPYHVVATGDTISLGSKTLRFIETRMIHWPDSMMTYVEEDKLLFSQDGFGQHWATSARFDDQCDFSELMYQAGKYYANILLLYSGLIRKLLENVGEMGLEIDMIAPVHGLIWRSHPDKILAAYSKWSHQETIEKAVVVYDTMWHSTEKMANYIVDGLQKEGILVKVYNMHTSYRSDVMADVLDARAIIMGSSTLNNGMLPRMGDVLTYMRGLRPANKIGAAFGSYGWGGESVKQLTAFLEEMKFEVVDPGVKVIFVPTEEDLKRCEELGRKVALAIKGQPVE